MACRFNRSSFRSGFTLIELSIVLIIIGLMAGGILIGKDLIHSAEIRSTITQLEKYGTAVNTFQSRYEVLPGDMGPDKAKIFGFYYSPTLGGQSGRGDENGFIRDWGGPQGESLVLWRHLSDAKLLENSYGTNGAGALDANELVVGDGSPGVIADAKNLALVFPKAKTGNNMFFVAYSDDNSTSNYFGLFNINQIGSGQWSEKNIIGLPPEDAYTIDSKIDDGLPLSGAVLARGFIPIAQGGDSMPSSGPSGCIIQNPPVYNFGRDTSHDGTSGVAACNLQLPF